MKYLISVFIAVFAMTVHAGEIIKDPDKVRAIFAGKTADANHLKRYDEWTNYFAPDGSMQRFTEDGELRKGKWHVNDKGEHCVKWDDKDEEWCRVIMAGFSDGVYFRIKLKGDRRIKLVKFTNFRRGNDLPK